MLNDYRWEGWGWCGGWENSATNCWYLVSGFYTLTVVTFCLRINVCNFYSKRSNKGHRITWLLVSKDKNATVVGFVVYIIGSNLFIEGTTTANRLIY